MKYISTNVSFSDDLQALTANMPRESPHPQFLSLANLVLLATFVFCLGSYASNVWALCITNPLGGTWINIDPNKDIQQIKFVQICPDTVDCPLGKPCIVDSRSGVIEVFTGYNGHLLPWGKADVYKHSQNSNWYRRILW